MPRTLQVSLPADQTKALLARLEETQGVLSISVQRGASQQPKGDVVVATATDKAVRKLAPHLRQQIVANGGSITINEPSGLMQQPMAHGLDMDSSETTVEEMGFQLRRDTNPSFNFFVFMALTGAVAAAGLWSDALVVVIGAMVIAPAFEPPLRMVFGAVFQRGRMVVAGLVATVGGFLLMAAAGAIMFLVLMTVDAGASDDLESRSLVTYWSSAGPAAVATSLLAAAAGGVAVAARRHQTFIGVVIALAVVPSMTIVGMALAAGDGPLAVRALGRWGIDMASLVGVGGAVLLLKRLLVHPRASFD